MPLKFCLSIASHVAAMAVGAAATAGYLTINAASPQSLADYISEICAKAFGSASAAEASYLAENVNAMTKMMIDMAIRPSGDVDADFVATMTPQHQGAIEWRRRNCVTDAMNHSGALPRESLSPSCKR